MNTLSLKEIVEAKREEEKKIREFERGQKWKAKEAYIQRIKLPTLKEVVEEYFRPKSFFTLVLADQYSEEIKRKLIPEFEVLKTQAAELNITLSLILHRNLGNGKYGERLELNLHIQDKG